MVIQKTPTKIDKIVSLRIGQQQENAATQIKMDVSDWITVHPTAGFHILFKRPGEVQAQPVLSSLEEGILTWTVQAWETALIGVGYAEVRAIEAESALVAKSRVIPCSVEDSIIEDGEVPPEFTGWVNTVLAAKDDANASKLAAQTAQSGAETARSAAENAATAAQGSQTYAEAAATAAQQSALQAGTYAGDSHTYSQNASSSASEAEHWADVARQGAEESGFVFFDVNDQDGHMYVTVTDSIGQDAAFAINENTGHLEVTING